MHHTLTGNGKFLKTKYMKPILILIISILILSANGQTESTPLQASVSLDSLSRYNQALADSIPLVVYHETENNGRQPAVYINGELSNLTIVRTLDPNLIDSVYVENKEIEIEGKKYYGQVFIAMKKEYSPKLISLADLRLKYTNPSNRPAIFMIDNEIFKGDYENYMVDEKSILNVIVDTVEDEEGQLNVDVVRLLTKTKENIEKSREIIIRGMEETTSN